MDSAKKFASDTPFDTSAVVSNAQKMLAYGFSDKDIIPDLKKIGNASAALGAGEEGISCIQSFRSDENKRKIERRGHESADRCRYKRMEVSC